uniref:SHR-BD domain-containing protein n=1 Tax=Echinococcus granulosus TaxID=6210 RepID=A0A068W721_ECHGR|nr:hypothetical protein EgrG_002015700 [Echinococcus granulosus]
MEPYGVDRGAGGWTSVAIAARPSALRNTCLRSVGSMLGVSFWHQQSDLIRYDMSPDTPCDAYRFLKPQCGEKQGLLRISFAATELGVRVGAQNELKAAIHSDFRLDTEILLSEATTPLKLVNLTNLGLSFDNWVLSTSALL